MVYLLHTEWTLWYDEPCRRTEATWDSALKELHTFGTVAAFWALQCSLAVPSKLPMGGNYYLFRAGIKPTWEAPRNNDGGRWQVS